MKTSVSFLTRLAIQQTGGIMFWALDHDAKGERSLVNASYQIVQKSSVRDK